MIRDDSGTFRRSNAPQVKFLAPSYTFVIREHKIDDKILVENPSVSMISDDKCRTRGRTELSRPKNSWISI